MATYIARREDAVEVVGRTIETLPNLRNGTVVEVGTVAYYSSIPSAYYWPIPESVNAANAFQIIDILVKIHQVRFIGEPLAREMAIVLAVARATAVVVWRLTPMDISECERSAPELYVRGGQWKWRGVTCSGETLNAIPDLAQEELDLIPGLVHIACPVMALQGLSLVESGHHFIPTTAMYFTKHMAHVMDRQKEPFRTWVGRMGTAFTDMMFHKAFHPVKPTLKKEVAVATGTSRKLREAGCPVAAVRFPAIPPDIRSARAAVAVFQRATQVIVAMGGQVNIVALRAALADVAAAEGDTARRFAVDKVAAVMDTLGPDIAYAAGIVQASNYVVSNMDEPLVRARVITRMCTDYISDMTEGATLHGVYIDKMKAKMRDGTYTARKIG